MSAASSDASDASDVAEVSDASDVADVADVSGVSDVSGVPGAHRTRGPAQYGDETRGPVQYRDETRGPAQYRDEDFPGCESFHLPADELDHYEYRLEFWDGATETAWRIPETPLQHEGPTQQLTQTTGRFAMLRGSRIACYGSAALVHRDATGRKRWLMQADEVLYLHPGRVRLAGPYIEVDADPLPDVVLEVDHTTDVRRRKLGIYKESGFPEIWVLVPWESSLRRPGLAIHVRRGGAYREEGESRAFPGWKAEEIHRALTEAPTSEGAWRALERVALSMGAREGTTPEDDPLMRSYCARARAEGYALGLREGVAESHREGRALGLRAGRAEGHREGVAEGHREGRAEGHREGRAEGHGEGIAEGGIEMLAANVLVVLKARSIAVARDRSELRELLGAVSGDVAMAAALACTDAADFRRRVREQRDLRTGPSPDGGAERQGLP